jgi:hypothetical protein
MTKIKFIKIPNSRLAKAIIEDKSLTCDKFKQNIVVTHDDGSRFTILNAIVKIEKEHLVVFHEHGHPIVFIKADVEWTRTLM